MGKCKYCQGEFDYIPGIGVCISCKNAMSSSSSNSYDSRKEAEAERAKDRAMDWYQYTDQFGNKVRVSRTTERFEVKRPFWGWMSAFKGNIERRYPNGDLYIGGVDGSLYHGKGKKFWKESGNSYEGDWVYDHRTGKGKFTWADGSYYEGDFVDGNFNGYGVRVYSDGCRYEGQFKDDKRHGKGKMTWPNGDTYEGDWRDDSRTGKGKYVWANGDYYEGDFLDNKRTGKGKYVWPNGCYYEGGFVAGKYHGYGKYLYTDGYIYVGEFRDNGRHGKGVLTAPDGTAVEYYYENDKIVCKAAEATDEIITRIYGTTPPKTTAKPRAEKKTTATVEVRKTETAVPVAKVVEESLEESSEQKIWNSLLKMSEKEKKAYFETHHELTVPAGTEVIPAKAFEFCLGLKKINFNDDIREIGEYAFYCTGIDSVLMIPKSVSKIRDHAFAMCHVEKIILPNNITVEEYAFAYIKALSEVIFETDLPQDVVFGKKVFARSDKHMTKEMIEQIKSIGSGAFK